MPDDHDAPRPATLFERAALFLILAFVYGLLALAACELLDVMTGH